MDEPDDILIATAELRRLWSEIAELRRERDTLLNEWPCRSDWVVCHDPANGKFAANDGRQRWYKTHQDAVRDLLGWPTDGVAYGIDGKEID